MATANRVYELRTYTCNPGKLNNLLDRFRIHTRNFFLKHRMQLEGFWIPIENEEQKIVYVLSFPDQSSREGSWREMSSDPEWLSIKEKSNSDGELVKVIQVTSMYPAGLPANSSPVVDDRVFELRTYKSGAGNQQMLLQLFRDQMLRLFEKYGISSIGCWEASEREGDPSNLLICLLAHRTIEDAKTAHKSFSEDAERKRDKGETAGSGYLTEPVRSVYLLPADFSPLK